MQIAHFQCGKFPIEYPELIDGAVDSRLLAEARAEHHPLEIIQRDAVRIWQGTLGQVIARDGHGHWLSVDIEVGADRTTRPIVGYRQVQPSLQRDRLPRRDLEHVEGA